MAKRGTTLQMKIVDLLAQGKSRQEIADALGCCLKTIDDTKADPALKRLYHEKQQQQIEELVPLALQRLEKLIKDDTQQGAVQIACIREILDRSHLKELLEVKTGELVVKVEYV